MLSSRSTPEATIREVAAHGPTGYSTLVINDQRIPLSDGTDLRALIGELLNAVKADGAVVHLVDRNGREYDVVVTSATHALICHGSASFEDGTPHGPWISSVNLDYY